MIVTGSSSTEPLDGPIAMRMGEGQVRVCIDAPLLLYYTYIKIGGKRRRWWFR